MCRKICSVRYVLSCLLFPTTQRWVLSLFYLPDEETEVPSGDLTVRSHSQQVAELGLGFKEVCAGYTPWPHRETFIPT